MAKEKKEIEIIERLKIHLAVAEQEGNHLAANNIRRLVRYFERRLNKK